jgi:glycosyltransferase involved in cell wall biosynthesis
MGKKLKVIMIAHASHSYFANKEDDLKKIVLNDWYFKTASQLRKFHEGIEVECWAPEKDNSGYEEYVENGIKLRFFPVSFSPLYGMDFSFSMLRDLKKEVEKSYRDGYEVVIHLHECHNLHGLVILDLFKNVRIIVQHHGGSWPLRHLRESWKKRLFFPLFWLGQLYESRVICNAEKFYALSGEEMDYLKSKNCNVVFRTMGIGDEYFDEINKRYARRELGIDENEKMIFFLGRVDRMKGVGYLLEAMKKFRDDDELRGVKLKDVKLKIAGYGKERDELERWAKSEGLDNVEFLGGVFGREKLLYLGACDLLVLPSLKEGAPVTVMEAMACNRPSVVSDVGGVRMMIEDGENGKVIRKANVDEIVEGVREVLSWKDKDVRKYANIYKWEKIVEDTVKDYIGEK